MRFIAFLFAMALPMTANAETLKERCEGTKMHLDFLESRCTGTWCGPLMGDPDRPLWLEHNGHLFEWHEAHCTEQSTDVSEAVALEELACYYDYGKWDATTQSCALPMENRLCSTEVISTKQVGKNRQVSRTKTRCLAGPMARRESESKRR